MCTGGCIVGGSGVCSPAASRGGGAPPTPPPRLGNQAWSILSGPLPRHLRPYARRQEPPHGPRALPGRAGRGRGARDARRPEALCRRVAPGGVRDLHALSPRRNELERFFYGSSHDAELDAAGRIMVPGFLGEHARLAKDVVVV